MISTVQKDGIIRHEVGGKQNLEPGMDLSEWKNVVTAKVRHNTFWEKEIDSSDHKFKLLV